MAAVTFKIGVIICSGIISFLIGGLINCSMISFAFPFESVCIFQNIFIAKIILYLLNFLGKKNSASLFINSSLSTSPIFMTLPSHKEIILDVTAKTESSGILRTYLSKIKKISCSRARIFSVLIALIFTIPAQGYLRRVFL